MSMFYDSDDLFKSDELTTQEKLDIIAERNKKNFTEYGNVSNEGIASIYNKFTNPLAKERRSSKTYANTPDQEFLDYLFRKDAVTSKDRASFKYKDEADDFTRNKHRFKEEQIGPNISNLAKGFLKNKDNIFLTGRDYDLLQDKLSKSKEFSEALVQETIDSGKKDGVSLGNIFARNAANRINTANVVAEAVGVPLAKTYDTGLTAIQDLANGDATLLAETALRTAGISADIALNISSGLLPHEIAQTAGAIGGFGVDDNETYLQNLGKRLYDQFLTTQIPGYGDFEVTDTSLYKGLEKVVMTEEDRKALEGTAIDTGVEGLALTALIANPFGVTSAPFKLAMKVPSGIYKGANRINSIVQLNGPLKKQLFPLIEKEIARVEKIKGRPLNNKELDEIQAIMNGNIIDTKVSILGGVKIKDKWKGGVTKDMQQYMLQQLDKYMANRAGNQYARQLNVKDKTSLPTTAQKDVMDLTIQGGGSANLNLISTANRTSPKTKGVTVGDQNTVLFTKKSTQEEIIEKLPIGSNHKLLLEMNLKREPVAGVSTNPRAQSGFTYAGKPNYTSPITSEMKNETFTYMQKLISEGYTFRELAKMDKIFPRIYLGIDSNGKMKGKVKYIEWAKANGADLFPEHNSQNRLGYNPDQTWFDNKRSTGFAAGNAIVDSFTNFIKTNDTVFLDSNAAAKFYLSSKGQIGKVTQKTIYGINDTIAGRLSSGSSSTQKAADAKQIKEYVTEVLTKSKDPDIIKFLGNNPTQVVDDLFNKRRKHIDFSGRLQQTYTMRTLNKEPQFMNNIHNAVGKQLSENTFEFNTELLNEVMKATGITDPVEASGKLFNYVSMHRGTYVVPGFDKRLLNPTIGRMLDDIGDFEKGFGEAVNLNNYLNSQIGKVIFDDPTISYRTIRDKISSQHPDFVGKQIDEMLSRRTAAQTGNEIYGIFIQPLDEFTNNIAKGRGTDRELGQALKILKEVDNFSKLEFNQLLSRYNQTRKSLLKEKPNMYLPEPVFGTKIPETQITKITERFGKKIANKFIDAAKKNGYYFKYEDGMRSIFDNDFKDIIKISSYAKGGSVETTTPEKDRIKAQAGIGVGNPRQNLFGFNIDSFMEEQRTVDQGLYDNKEPDIPEGKFNPYEVSRIIDREDEIMQKRRELGYLPVGEGIKEYNKRQRETAFNLKPREKKLEEIREQTRELLNPGKTTKLKLSETGQLFTQNPLFRQTVGTGLMVQTAPMVIAKAFADDVVGMLEGRGEGFDDVKKIIPTLYKMSRSMQPEFSEQEYISVIQEINKMQDAGVNNLAFGIVDALGMGIDFMADADVQRKVKDLYDEADIEKPETFLGKLGALGIELGAPAGTWFKVMNRARTALRAKGFNTFVDKSTGSAGFAYAAQKVSNIAKRSAVLGSTFGVSDAVGMSRYSTVNELFEDPLLLSDKESIEGLSGRELALTNFRNRLRFGADGAMIGGLFPLVGPPAWAVTKIAAGEVGSAIGAVGKYVINPPMTSIANTLAGKSTVLTRAAEDTIAVVTGMRPELTGPIGKTGQVVSGSIQAINNFVGKQIVTRALLGAQDLTQVVTKNLYGRGINMEPEGASQLTFLTRQLPERKEWSMFSVNSYDPLKQNLARIDNVMGMFRDIGKLSKDAFFLSGEAKLFIKSNMRATEDYLRLIEDESYNLAQNFQKRYNKYGESKHLQNHYMDQVLGFLKGKVKLEHLAPELRETAKRLNDHLTALRKKFADLLPAGGMKDYMETNLREYMRKSFAMFTNPNFYPSKESIAAARKYMAEMIEKDPTLKFQAELAFPDRPLAEAIKQSAELRIADFMETLRYEMDDPLIGMQNAAKKDLGLEDLVIQTGEELPTVLRKLLGEENNLKASVLQTASSLSHQAAQKIALDKVAKLGLEGGWLFRTAEEARDLGKIINASQVKETGTGLLHTDSVGLYGAPEIVGQLNGFNMFDSILKNKIYHNLIAFKATVQGGKTLYSPATQARNFGSASLFALNQGHIGGKVSVGESFKMIMDDIFGPGGNADPLKVIENITRKIRLGVLDENIVAEELGAVLRELKGQQTGVYSMTGLTNRVGDTQLTKLVQKMYAGGDNIWKWHGHEYVKSQLSGNIRSIDEISDYFTNVIGRKFEPTDAFTGKVKTVAEGIEEMAAYMIRETYPTYSRVPPVIQALRKFPFGNFISFPAEIMRTTFAATGLSLKHIASDNPTLRAMGYKGLLGQLTTLYGVGATTQAISSAMTGIDERQMDAYTQFLGPEYMRFHQLIPITTKQRDGSFKAFDMSAYNPYDYMIAPIEGIIQNLERMRLEGTPGKIDDDMFNTMYALDGPLASLISPFIAETIGLEPFFDVLPSGYAVGGRGGITKSGSKVYDKDDTKEEKYNKSFAHILGAIAPGVYTTGVKVYGALQADISQGQQINLADQLFKLMGGSTIVINPNKALDYKVADIKKIRGQAYNTEHFFGESNWQNRPAEVLEAEFENIQDQAFRAQFQVYEMFKESLESGLLKKSDVRSILKDRGFSNKQIRNLTEGVFTPVTFSESAMEKRAKNIKAAYPGVFIRTIDLYPKQKLKDVIRRYKNKRFIRFIDPETLPERPTYKERPNLSQAAPQPNIPVPPLPDTGTPEIAPNQMANVSGTAVSPQTGLTNSESVYLSPTEQLYRRKERGLA